MDLSGHRPRTARMLLRPYVAEDFDAFHDLHSRDVVARYLPWPTRDEAASRTALERQRGMALDDDGDDVRWAGTEADTGRLVGEFVLMLRSVEHGVGEIGYVLHPDFWGRGLATEGALELLRTAFEVVRLRRVVARLDARNTASAAVLRRLGMRHEAHLVENELFKGEWGDEDQFALLAREWSMRGGPVSGHGRGVPDGHG